MPNQNLSPVGPPLHGFRGEEPAAGPLRRPKGLTIAVSREAGSRGGTVARKVGELLGWQVFDQEMLDYLVQDDAARGQLFADLPPGARDWADAQLTRLRADRGFAADAETGEMARLVFTVAARGEAVVVGRGAGFFLPPETTLHVRVVAPPDARVAYVAESLRLTANEAAAEVRARDVRRTEFVTRTFRRDPTAPHSYDLIVNTARIRTDGAAQLVALAVRTKHLEPDPGPADFPGA